MISIIGTINRGANRWVSEFLMNSVVFLFVCFLPWPEAEHGYASVLPLSPDHPDKRSKQKNKKMSGGGNRWSKHKTITEWQQGVVARSDTQASSFPPCRVVHNELEKNRSSFTYLQQCWSLHAWLFYLTRCSDGMMSARVKSHICIVDGPSWGSAWSSWRSRFPCRRTRWGTPRSTCSGGPSST